MVSHLKHSEINKQKWDSCILAQIAAWPYALSWYLDCVAPNWEALVLNDYEAVMPLPCRVKWGINYIYTPRFVQQLGVFGKGNLPLEQFIQAIPAKFSYIDINLNEGNTLPRASLNTNTLLNLNKPLSQLQTAFADNTKRNAKKAEKAGYHIAQLPNADDIISLFKANRGQDIDFTGADYNLLQHLVAAAQSHNACTICGVKNTDGETVAGAVFVHTPGRHVFLFSGNNAQARQNGAMHLLLSEYIKQHAETDSVLDFEGSNNADLARFYLSFGGYSTQYPKLKINRLPCPLRWLKK